MCQSSSVALVPVCCGVSASERENKESKVFRSEGNKILTVFQDNLQKDQRKFADKVMFVFPTGSLSSTSLLHQNKRYLVKWKAFEYNCFSLIRDVVRGFISCLWFNIRCIPHWELIWRSKDNDLYITICGWNHMLTRNSLSFQTGGHLKKIPFQFEVRSVLNTAVPLYDIWHVCYAGRKTPHHPHHQLCIS